LNKKIERSKGMKKSKATKTQVKKERSPKKVEEVIKAKGHPNGKLPKDKELHQRTMGSHLAMPHLM